MQMYSQHLWVFVENHSDIPFYSGLCSKTLRPTNHRYIIERVENVPEFRGDGKKALLGLYRRLRRRRLLLSTLEGKATGVLFFLDKDIDDIRGCRARSPHVHYTEHYCMENYLFRHGDLARSVSAVGHVDIQEAIVRIATDTLAWTRAAAECWRDWVVYCVLVVRLKVRTQNYGASQSLIHDGVYSAVNSGSQERLLSSLRNEAGLDVGPFRRKHASARAYVDRLYRRGLHDRVFSGKWYARFLVEDCRQVAAAGCRLGRNAEKRLVECLFGTLDFSAPWTERFEAAIAAVAAML